MRRKNALALAAAGGLGLFATLAIGSEIVHTLAADFTTVDAGTGFNVTVSADELALTSATSLYGTDWYRGPASFGQAEWTIELEKDDVVTPVFFDSLHPCLDTADVSGFYTDAFVYDGFLGRYRVGDEAGATEEATLGSAIDILGPDWEADANFRASELRFLTSGSHSNAAVPATSDYTVTIDYAPAGAGAEDVVIVIPVPLDSSVTGAAGDVVADDSGNGICDFGDAWCITESGDAVGAATIACDSDDDDEGHLWEVQVFLDDTLEIGALDVAYTTFDPLTVDHNGLGGPLAATLIVDEPTYSSHASAFGMFDYQGEFATLTNVIDAGDNALWFEVEYSQTIGDGEIRVEVDCDEATGGYQAVNWNNGGAWPYQSGAASPIFAWTSAIDQDDDTPGAPADDNPGDHCRGRYASYVVYLLSTEDPLATPTLQDITLRYAVDSDQDGWGIGLDLPPHQAGQEDECDNDPAITGAAPAWFADCDGDGVARSASTCNACSAADAVATCATPCSDTLQPDGGWFPAAGTDCDDEDAGAADPAKGWYADCDGDGVTQGTADIAACTMADALADTAECSGNGNGDNPFNVSASAPATPDCDDADSGAADPNTGWFADCDGDAALQGTADIAACTMADAMADTTECAGNGNGNNPFAVSTAAPVTPDCDDTDATGQVAEDWYPDCDNDGVFASSATNACGQSGANTAFDCVDLADPDGGWSTAVGTDCDDEDAAAAALTTWYPDCDNDGVFQASTITACTQAAAEADTVVCAGNTNGGAPFAVSASAPATPDCDDLDDEAADPNTLWYANCDADGENSSTGTPGCTVADATTPCADGLAPDGGWGGSAGLDCDDEDPAIFTGNTPVVNDGKDNDCSTGGVGDECYEDLDGDGFGTNNLVDSANASCADAGESTLNSDCDDTLGADPALDGRDAFPGKSLDDEDVLDGQDNDCDTHEECFADADDDGVGLAGTYASDLADDGCNDVALDTVLESSTGTDCNDADGTGTALQDWYPDCDGDGVLASVAVNACGISGANAATPCGDGLAPDGGWSNSAGTDCDDEDVVAADPNHGWHADCDGDGATQTTGDIAACTMADALADTTECSGNGNGDQPFLVTFTAGTDCDDADAGAQGAEAWYHDCDNDGVFSTSFVNACGTGGADAAFDCADGLDPDGGWTTTAGTDCDDEDALYADPNQTWYADCDGDAALQGTADITSCSMTTALADAVECAGNGNGGLPFAVSTSAPVTPDCDDTDASGQVAEDWYPDCDNDAVFASGATNACGTSGADAAFDCADAADPDGGWTTTPGTDCNDEDGAASALADWYPDCDGDGVFDTAATNACGTLGADTAFDCADLANPDGGWSGTLGTDCDDEDALYADPNQTWYADCDGDGITQGTADIASCSMTTALTDATECAGNGNGGNPFNVSTTAPGTPDCDDDDATYADPTQTWYADCDGDGITQGTADIASCSMTTALANTTECAGNGNGGRPFNASTSAPGAADCDDANSDAYPGNVITDAHVDNGADNDCVNGEECFVDFDDDGFGESGSYINETGNDGCTDTSGDGIGESSVATDCHPSNAQAYPGKTLVDADVADPDDNDCSGGLGNLEQECFADNDDDGFGVPGSYVTEDPTDGDNACANTIGNGVFESSLATDCHDDNADAWPGNTIVDAHVADPDDNDCSGGLGNLEQECFFDGDDDGWGISGSYVTEDQTDGDDACSNTTANGILESSRTQDCDDGLANVNPGLADVCGDGLDNDCDGNGNFATPGPGGYLDDDGDGVVWADEQLAGTDDCNGDTDGDGLTDDEELNSTGTDPLIFDTDGDQLGDGFEVGADALNPIDSDGDGTHDALDPDDDGDSVDTFDEDVDGSGTPLDDDTDGDGTPDYLDDDDDDDGLLTITEAYAPNSDPLNEDTDGDGIPDFRESDDDNDGISTAEELVDDPADIDGDGRPGYRDLDSDADGWSDAHEYATSPALNHDTDGDGDRDHVDLDSDDDSVLDDNELGTEALPLNQRDTDGDGLENRIDPDDDGDSIPTIDEAYGANTDPLAEDTDTDGFPDFLDADDDDDLIDTIDEAYAPNTDPRLEDSDVDGTPDYRDNDDDDDTILTRNEDRNLNGDPRDDDADGDLIPNYLDDDDDNDGVLTANESPDGDGNPLNDNTDSDGLPNWLDNDDDNDGVLTSIELAAVADPDGDGIPNWLDLDSDQDTWSDEYEYANGQGGLRDTDGDGNADYVDVDSDDDSVIDDDEIGNELLAIPLQDTDGDGIPNRLDPDDDGDSVATIDEDPNGDGNPRNDDTDLDGVPNFRDNDDDGDGILTILEDPNGDGDPLNDNTDAATGDTAPNFLDVDDDGDNVDTIDESPDGDGNPLNDDTDGDGTANYLDDDDDGDGLLTRLEDPAGTGNPLIVQSDSDGVPDFLDSDDDDDSVPTADEDVDGDGDVRNDNTDGDGLPNYRDVDDDQDNVDTIDESPDGDGDPRNDDTDGDGTPDYLDTDDDGDSLLTRNEDPSGSNAPLGVDSDGDGTDDYLDDDDDNDNVPTIAEDVDGDGEVRNDNTDGDGLADYLDVDDDGDNVDTIDESPDADTDPRNDDTDGDGTANYLDVDDDGDGLDTILEDPNANANPLDDDTDGDGAPDFLDDDDDNDGALTAQEDRNLDGDVRNDDTDGDGTPDYRDNDDDNDTVLSADEDRNGDGNPLNDDTDGDGVPDFRDTDDDDDTVLTADEDADNSGSVANDDTDGDGTPNYLDNDDDGDSVLTANESPDLDGDPLNDDTDTDGIADFLDSDDDGDNVPTIAEDPNGDGDPRNDNTDGDARPNYLDSDDDGDSILTRNESPDADTDPLNDDTDADGTPNFLDTDDDGDSVDTIDEDPNGNGDPLDDDTDADGTANWIDVDDDGDTVLTINESPDGDGDPLNDDTDGDGRTDFLDTDDDGDTVLTIDESPDGDGDPLNDDTDADGTADFLDSDDDGDTVLTIDESPDGDANPMDDDTDGDGTANYLDVDDDGDNVLTSNEIYGANTDPLLEDTDGDGTADFLDADDDGDSVATIDETWDADTDPMNDDTDGDGAPNYLDTDDDDDSVLTIDESPDGDGDPLNDDTDGDGTVDHLDTDDDGDTLATILEDPDASGSVADDDTDGDGIANYLDSDDDGDSVLTAAEDRDASGDVRDDDSDGDGTADFLDMDDDNDLVDTIDESPDGDGNPLNDDTDGDGIADWLDDDDDGDGLLTSLEDPDADGDPLSDDTDGDGTPDFLDSDDDNDAVPTIDEDIDGDGDVRNDDTDGDGTPDYRDADDDGDSVATIDEDPGANGDPQDDDTDLDGTPDYLDTDDDNDSVLTVDESPDGDGDPLDDDTDGDGTANYLDTDDDGDSVDTINESPDGDGDPRNDDTDGDALVNYLDDDDDGDTVLTIDEDPNNDADPLSDDTDGDGMPDFLDDDDDDDAVLTADEAYAPNTDPLLEDTDGDGTPDFLDADDDDDAVLTVDEAYAGNTDPMLEDSDADGTPDYLDVDDDDDAVDTVDEAYAGNTDPMAEDTDGDGIPDYLDTDDDGDGVPTIDEDVVDGDGDPMTDDTDGDGLANYIDDDDDGDTLRTIDEDLNGNGDPTETPQDDFDFDGVPDYLDDDDDNDNVPTRWEVAFGVDHHNFDTDGDSVNDGQEWLNWLRTDVIIDCALADCDDANGGATGASFADPWDRDADSIINPLDGDDDGDGIQTLLEPQTDNECLGGFDGIPTYLDFDADGDGIDDAVEGEGDDDGDFIPNFLDCDNTGCVGDTDNDGIPNCRDVELAGGNAAAALDPDMDNDGVIDGDEVGSDPNCLNPDIGVSCNPLDTDGDGIIDILDDDDDGDGFPTIDELFPDCPGVVALDLNTLQIECDGVPINGPENTDADTGGAWPLNPDDVPDYLDDDDDGDGRPSSVEGDGDVDGDGIVNYLDPNDNDGPLGDADQDGLTNGQEASIGSDPYSGDTDGDTIPDGEEYARGDTDSDGIPDILDSDDDGDGIPTVDEGVNDIDGDGVPNYLDRDRDGDGLDDDVESQTEDGDCDGVVDIDDGNPLDGPCSLSDTGLSGGDVIEGKGGCDGCSGTGSTPVGGAALLVGLAGLLARRRRS